MFLFLGVLRCYKAHACRSPNATWHWDRKVCQMFDPGAAAWIWKNYKRIRSKMGTLVGNVAKWSYTKQ